jgi:hypothetical protein
MPQTLTLHEITDLLETDDSTQASAIVIQPPENATAPVSNEDSGDEGSGTLNNLPASLLRAPAYLIQDGYNADSDSDGPSIAPEDEFLDEVSSTSAAQQPPPPQRQKVMKVIWKWKKADIVL